jgi:ribonuclease E
VVTAEWAPPVPELAAEAPVDAVDTAAVPGHDGTEEAAAEGAKGRPRSRRGRGRRKRPEDEASPNGDAAPFVAAPPYQAPAYQGPTPADPFGGGTLDIFDVLEMAEAKHLLPPTPPQIPPTETTAPRRVSETAAPAAAAPDTISVASVVASIEAEAEPTLPEPAAEPVTGPVIRPVVIGEDAPTAEKKRGWWRR